jgi:hypothetical protein
MDAPPLPTRDIQPLLQQPETSGAPEQETQGQTLQQKAEAALTSMRAFSWPQALRWTRSRSAEEAESPAPSRQNSIPVIVEDGGEGSSNADGQGNSSPKVGDRRGNPVCLICLEEMTADDFKTGRALALQCACRGDLALRHKECATKWAQVKDDGRGGIPTCELCKQPVRNLPAVAPRPRPDHVEVTIMDDGFGESCDALHPPALGTPP